MPAIHMTSCKYINPSPELYAKIMNVSAMQIRIFYDFRVTLLQNKKILKLLFGRLNVLAFSCSLAGRSF